MSILQKHLVFIPLLCLAFIVMFGGCVMLLWNWLMPELFGLPQITFWQSAGLLLLCKILFGGFGSGHHGKHHHGCGCCPSSTPDYGEGNKLREHWESLSPEERERIIAMHKENASPQEPQEKLGKNQD